MTIYYSTQSFLAYCLNHYFYNGMHYANCAFEFYPYKKSNPASSNPLVLYQGFFHPWRDLDPHDNFILAHRIRLQKGVIFYENLRTITPTLATELKEFCQFIDVGLIFPIVFRIDPSRIDNRRLVTDGSGVTGSQEVLIKDLQEHEFEVLFCDYDHVDPDIERLMAGNIGDDGLALSILRSRVVT